MDYFDYFPYFLNFGAKFDLLWQQISNNAPLFTSNSVQNTTTSVASKHCATTSARSKSASLTRALRTSVSHPISPTATSFAQ